MKAASGLSRQWNDLLAYVLFPALFVLIPASLSRGIVRRISCWESLLRADADQALASARKHLEIPDEAAWKRRWKQVELVDVRDLYMMLFGRSRAVLAEIELPEDLELARDRVMVGMHWGPAISILKLLSQAGMQPTFPYRPPEREVLSSRPFYYLFCRLSASYLHRTLKERAVSTGGAGKVLSALLDVPGSICVLMDAPVQQGRPAMTRQLLGAQARFNVGFSGMFIEREKEYVLYAMNLADDGSTRKKLELHGPFRAADNANYLENYVQFLDRHLAADSSQWRIWRAEHQVWMNSDPGGDHQ